VSGVEKYPSLAAKIRQDIDIILTFEKKNFSAPSLIFSELFY
jgi:hypothetical protein